MSGINTLCTNKYGRLPSTEDPKKGLEYCSRSGCSAERREGQHMQGQNSIGMGLMSCAEVCSSKRTYELTRLNFRTHGN